MESLQQARHSAAMSWWQPGLVFAAALLITLALWGLQEHSHRAQLYLETEVTAEQAGKRLRDWVHDRMSLAGYLAAKWQKDYAGNVAGFEADALQFVHSFPGFQAINWMDSDWVIRVVVPLAGNEPVLNASLRAHPNAEVSQAIRRAILNQQESRTPAIIDLLQGGKGFATYWPVFDEGGNFIGAVNAVFRVDELIEECFNRLQLSGQFQVAIQELNGDHVYPADAPGSALPAPNTVMVNVAVVDQPWRMYLTPSPGYLQAHQWYPHHLILPVGLLLSLALGVLARIVGIRKRALELSRRQYRALFEQAPVAYFSVAPKGVIERANEAARTITGLERDEIVGRSFYDLFADSSRGRTRLSAVIEAARSGTIVRDVELEMVRADGASFWTLQSVYGIHDEDGGLSHFSFMATDITDRREVEAARARLSAAIEQAEEGVAVLNADGTIAYVNPAFRRINRLGGEPSTQSLAQFLRQEGVETTVADAIEEALGGGQGWQGAYALPAEDGPPVRIVSSLSPVRDESGSLMNYVLLQRDNSQEEALQARLRQVHNMEAIGRLAGGIAHDFNNILQSLLGYASLASRQIDEPAEVARCIGEIERAGRRAAELVTHILAFGRRSDVAQRPVAIGPVVEEVANLLRGRLPEDVELDIAVENRPALILGDQTQLHQILMNLASNALHAMRSGGGRLSIRLDCVQLSKGDARLQAAMAHGEYVRLCIADTGVGMEKSTLERMFEPYFSTREVGYGTGLGLATVHGLVQQHRGAIHVESVPRRGTSFTLYFPTISEHAEAAFAQSPEAPAAESDVAGTSDPGRDSRAGDVVTESVRVLYVDDDAQIVDSMSRILRRFGYEVESFTASPAALAAVKAAPEHYDIMITDLTMPEMTGIELARATYQIRPDLPAILCSGYGEALEHEIGKRHQCIRSFLQKPVSAAALVAEIRKLCSERSEVRYTETEN